MTDTLPDSFHHAGFWLRVWAKVIDSVLVLIIQILVIFTFVYNDPYSDDSLWPTFWLFVVNWVFYAAFHASSLQATPGKLLLGIKVVGLDGERISFGRALGRGLAEILSYMLLLIGYIMAAFTRRKQALHDLLADTLVIRAAAGTAAAVAPSRVSSLPSSVAAPVPADEPKRDAINAAVDASYPDDVMVETSSSGTGWTLAGFSSTGNVQRMQITPHELDRYGGVLEFGRDPERCALVVDDMTVSGLHGQLRIIDGCLEIVDANSTNGTWVNEERLAADTWMPLADGDRVQIGGTELRVFRD